ncbi:dolichyl-phosphate-mannose--protein mannosyltransferase [Nesterenkonia sedimenti]|uniref:dolichyl-phosphate-mannose--protein mannosyltransferase n=1 Tax=Nesterenkonia sedimenti TaxID=1463632 RepID=UPI002D2196FC|nr:phospholipid carrier-dependent glycosyltransferase [Nesterenkonia sedimenti]
MSQADTTEKRRKLELRLGADRFSPGWLGAVVPAVVAVFAALLRFPGLSDPHALIFDETYYAKDAYALLEAGYELEWPEGADDVWLAEGETPQPGAAGSYVVHPPLGKWLIAIGIHLFGIEQATGWRFAPALAGVLGTLLVALVAQRMFRSVFLGGVAGVLTAVEGHHLVMSRVALLDIFLMLFVLAAFAALLADRYSGRRRLAAWAAETPSDSQLWTAGPWLLWRPWRLVAGVLLGCAVAVKLSGLAFIAVFGIMVVLWDIEARRTLGIRRWLLGGLLRDGLPAVLTVLPMALLTYLASWTGWLLGERGWDRDAHPNPLVSLWRYHSSATDFHTGLDSEHEYASHPWTWLFAGRPVSMHYQSREEGEAFEHTAIGGEPAVVCPYDHCSSAVLDLPNPLIWWTGVIALLLVLLLWFGRRDFRYGAILAGWVGGFFVWLLVLMFGENDRTMFFFYTISYHPFLILAITAVAALVLRVGTSPVGRDGQSRPKSQIISAQQRNTVMVLCFVLLAIAVSAYFWPLWTAEIIPYEQWRQRMWLQSWI